MNIKLSYLESIIPEMRFPKSPPIAIQHCTTPSNLKKKRWIRLWPKDCACWFVLVEVYTFFFDENNKQQPANQECSPYVKQVFLLYHWASLVTLRSLLALYPWEDH